MPGGAPTAHLRVSDALTLLREQNLTDCLNADVLDYAAATFVSREQLLGVSMSWLGAEAGTAIIAHD